MFQQKTEDIEQVFGVVSEEKDIGWDKFGSFRRVTRIYAYYLRFQAKIKEKVVKTEKLQQVILMLLRKSQIESFGPTDQSLAAGKPMAASDRLNKLSLFMDDQNLMQLRGRLRHADAGYDMKNPFFLSANHPIVRKLCEVTHESNYHECVKCRKQQVGVVQLFIADLP